ncbi:MAG: cytochrome b/b6 domain-containing protein [Gammaproteobacteria bacterium]|nr:cytochrome b/b6 domain-containing protein [Gammaproteobacteria bacterium]
MTLKTYSAQFRLWHWLNAIAILGLLGTVLLRKTFLSYKTNSSVLVEELSKLDITIALEDAKTIAKVIRAPMWEWHYIFGWALVVLFACRIVLHIKDRPFFSLKEFRRLTTHHKGTQSLYTILYVLISVMVVTGVMLYFKQDLGLSKELSHDIKEFHEILMYVFAFFVPIHILSAFIAENKGEPGLVSNMISGKKNSE